MYNENQTGSVQQQVKETTAKLSDQLRDTSSDVTQKAQETAKTTVENQKGRVAETFHTVADALRQTGKHLGEQDQAPIAHFADMAAARLEQFSGDLQHKSVDEILGDVQDFARRDPHLFIGGAMLLGLLATRFLKSSANHSQPRYGQLPATLPQSGFRQGQYGTSQGSYGSAPTRRYDGQDLADYRRGTLDTQYTGTPARSGFATGVTNPAGSERYSSQGAAGDPLSGFDKPASSTEFGAGSGLQGHNPPSNTKPGERSDFDRLGRSEE